MPRWINSRSEIIYSSVLNRKKGPHGPVSKKGKINSQRCLSFKSNQLWFCHVFSQFILPHYIIRLTHLHYTDSHENKHISSTSTVNAMGLERAPAINVQPASPRLVQASGERNPLNCDLKSWFVVASRNKKMKVDSKHMKTLWKHMKTVSQIGYLELQKTVCWNVMKLLFPHWKKNCANVSVRSQIQLPQALVLQQSTRKPCAC